jgi:hypothetical protein
MATGGASAAGLHALVSFGTPTCPAYRLVGPIEQIREQGWSVARM